MGILRLINNIRYLCRYNLKELYYSNQHKIDYKKLAESMNNVSYFQKTKKQPSILTVDETIEILVNSNKSIARFGDGEFFLTEGVGNCFQEYNNELANRLKEVLKTKSDNILVGINHLYYNIAYEEYTDTIQEYFLSHIWKVRQIIEKYIDISKQYAAAEFTQLYQIYSIYEFKEYFDKVKKIWDNKDIVIGCGKTVFDNIKYNIFSNAKNIQYEYMPSKNAYTVYDELVDRLKKYDKEKLIILILGQTATILAYDLSNAGYRALDLGHIAKDYDYFMKKIERNHTNAVKFFSAD